MVLVNFVLICTKLHKHLYRLDLAREYGEVERRVVWMCVELSVDVDPGLLQRKQDECRLRRRRDRCEVEAVSAVGELGLLVALQVGKEASQRAALVARPQCAHQRRPADRVPRHLLRLREEVLERLCPPVERGVVERRVPARTVRRVTQFLVGFDERTDDVCLAVAHALEELLHLGVEVVALE